MKIINYLLSIVMGLFSLLIISSGDFLIGLTLLLACIIFFLFGLIEEQNKKIFDLRQTILKFKDHYMIE
jgi:hypothetical protein